MELLNSTVGPLVPWVATEVSTRVAYPFKVSSNIRALQSALRELGAQKRDTQTEIMNAERENGAPTEQVKLWLDEVEAIETQAANTCEKYQQLCRCIQNISPNIWSNYKISKRAATQHAEVMNLYKKKETIQVIIHMPPSLALEIPASSSKSSNLKYALHYVKDDMQCNIIGIWGMGGVGKTHLLKQINNELCRGHIFDVVLFVTCSKECSEEKVQNKIIDKLGLSKSDSMEQKQSTICNFLIKKSFVLLLDDLWSHVDLEIIGIPDIMSAGSKCKRKVVLTTRSTEVCGKMEVKKQINVECMKWDDAWSLFEEKATKETIQSHPLIQNNYAMDVVKKLGGLPLALITVGRAMRDKIDPNEWEQAIMQLKKARFNDVELSHEQLVFHTLKLGYDSLKNDTLKQCFLHCSLWPEDFCIEKDEHVQLWMGLGLIDEVQIQVAYNMGYSYIRRLQALCLLESDDDGSIKMHDVIRDMALWIANNYEAYANKWIVQASSYKESQVIELSHNTEKLSIMNNYAREVFFFITSSSTKCSTLLLSRKELSNSRTLRLELFSELVVLDLSYNHLKVFPIEICILLHLQFLNLSGNFCLDSIPEELGALKKLKYLLLRGIQCSFPDGVVRKLKALRVLDLSGRSMIMDGSLTIFPKRILCKMNVLRRPIMRECYPHNNLEIPPTLHEDLQSLPNFQALGISISSMHDFYEFSQYVRVPVRWLDISIQNESCLSFSNSFLGNSQIQSTLISLDIIDSNGVECVEFESTSEIQSICHLWRLERLSFTLMPNMKEVIWNGLDPKDVFSRLQVLQFENCRHLRSISWVVTLPCIQELTVTFCLTIKQLVSMDELQNNGNNVSQHSFLFLKTMILWANLELELISDPMITFPALEFLEVGGCDKLKKLPFKSSSPPKKLKLIRSSEEWWNNIEMEDASHRSSLQHFFHKLPW